MKLLRRLRAVAAGLAVVAAVASTQVWADSASGRNKRLDVAPATLLARPDFGRDLNGGRFSTRPVLTYALPQGDSLFALQVRPALDAVAGRPRDIAVVIDTSASQAGKPMQMARDILEKLATQASPVDRISIWIANTPRTTRNLTSGFIEPTAAAIQAAIKNIKDSEYASGATDLKDAITKVVLQAEPVADADDANDRAVDACGGGCAAHRFDTLVVDGDHEGQPVFAEIGNEEIFAFGQGAADGLLVAQRY